MTDKRRRNYKKNVEKRKGRREYKIKMKYGTKIKVKKYPVRIYYNRANLYSHKPSKIPRKSTGIKPTFH